MPEPLRPSSPQMAPGRTLAVAVEGSGAARGKQALAGAVGDEHADAALLDQHVLRDEAHAS